MSEVLLANSCCYVHKSWLSAALGDKSLSFSLRAKDEPTETLQKAIPCSFWCSFMVLLWWFPSIWGATPI